MADQLGLVHHVFNFTEEFERRVVAPYVEGHAAGRTPNPCIECNRHLKFDRLFDRARALGFDALATGHHARWTTTADGRHRLLPGGRPGQGPVLRAVHAGPGPAGPVLFPVGELTKAEVRAEAPRWACAPPTSPTARTCASSGPTRGAGASSASGWRSTPAGWSTPTAARTSGRSTAVELVTVGQRRGMGHGADGRRRYVTAVDVPARRVRVGPPEAADSPARGPPHRHLGGRRPGRPAAGRPSVPWPSAAPTGARRGARCDRWGTAPCR